MGGGLVLRCRRRRARSRRGAEGGREARAQFAAPHQFFQPTVRTEISVWRAFHRKVFERVFLRQLAERGGGKLMGPNAI